MVPISVRVQEGRDPGQAISAQACAGSLALRDSGFPVPCHCGYQVRPAVTECQISARAAPLADWPSSQPEAGRGNATAV